MGHRRYPFWSTEADAVVKATAQGLLAGSGIIEESRQVPEPRINADQRDRRRPRMTRIGSDQRLRKEEGIKAMGIDA